MSMDDPATQNHGAAEPECELWFQFSEWARDAGDRAFSLVLAVAVAEAMVLAAGWLWAMPSLGWPW